MVAEKAWQIDQINERMTGPYKLKIISIDECELLEKNARYMKNETFQNLVNNIKRDGGLSSVPFCYLTEEGKYRVLSGNHRVQAAKAAGFTEILIMYTDKPMTKDEQIAVQLAHNSLVGEDDPVILQELYNEIEDLTLKYYSGLDDKVLQQLEKVQVSGLTEAQLDYLSLSFVFLPEEAERLVEVFERVKNELASDAILARHAEYSRLLDAVAKTQGAYNIHNGATALMLILDVFERHQADLKAGWLDEDGGVIHKSFVPISSILGTDMIPAPVAVILHQAVEKMMSTGEITNKNKWQVLEYLSADYLSGE
ncbi:MULTISPECIES: ParB/RepB/Spo0J family partition protein [unclassified Thermoactinomyces]|uniref:ParB/RepB/Spo0J family partition protein n=1 Tax=unclassified Thermoactinomyces TaxID=2634588 RepID=UPI0018DD5509|nr:MULTISPECIES: ParB/RepB/Spo0J family partition protein [unclassified Thermoactinomyces]MBH8599084.1 ParB-like nuclease domain-containing protein [Thermoactinomyces sp. CICC 10523]MBH8607985.1 ParB-like nuclease domain-containing protein [Thermoactinomyces sp. CICC 10521]